MNEMINKDCNTAIEEVAENANTNVNISLEDWPCTVAVLGICATIAFVEWLHTRRYLNTSSI